MADDPFVDYYERQSESPATIRHFLRLRSLLLRVLGRVDRGGGAVRVADLGCGAGTFSRIWCEAGCQVGALDVNPKLIAIARSRVAPDGNAIDFRIGSASELPWADSSFDIVVMPELLEHVVSWRRCLSEAARVLRPGGVLYVSTTNRLCPVQQEFSLPLYSWYPGWLKARCLERALTTHRQWVNHAEYPAVNWFDAYSLGSEFRRLDMAPIDRFDLLAEYSTEPAKRFFGRVASRLPVARFLAHVMSPGLSLVGRKT